MLGLNLSSTVIGPAHVLIEEGTVSHRFAAQVQIRARSAPTQRQIAPLFARYASTAPAKSTP